MTDWNSKTTKLMQIFDMENDFIKHRQKVIGTQRKNSAVEIKRACENQMSKINSFRKHWKNANTFKLQERQKEINNSNKILHMNLYREYNRRHNSITSSKTLLESRMRSSSSSRVSLASEKSRRQSINEENVRLLKKISAIESTLSHTKMKEDFKKGVETRKRLEIMSVNNKKRMRDSLRKMNVEARIYFPRSSKFNTILN